LKLFKPRFKFLALIAVKICVLPGALFQVSEQLDFGYQMLTPEPSVLVAFERSRETHPLKTHHMDQARHPMGLHT
jgi:hypothetical protein